MDFRTFWERYPRKVARQDAQKAWNRLSMIDAQAAYDALDAHIQQWSERDRQYIPHAATWIRGRRWEDEMESTVSDREFFFRNGFRRNAS